MLAYGDRIISLIFIALGVGQCLWSLHLELGSASEPKTGFMPFLIGLIVTILSAILLVDSTVEVRKTNGTNISPWSDIHWKRIIFMIILLLAYCILLRILGYLISTFLLIVFLIRIIEPLNWRATFAMGIITSIISYLIFDVWLQVSFPHGILSF